MNKSQMFEQATVCLEQGNYERSVALLENCIEENPDKLIYYWYLGLAYLLQERIVEAQDIWLSILLDASSEEAESLTVELIAFLGNQIQEHLKSKRLGNAKIIYDTIVEINPNYENINILNDLVESLSDFAARLSDQEERAEAISVYKEILNLNPTHSISWHSLALNYYYQGLYLGAEKAIQEAIDLDDSSVTNYHVLGLILEKLENYSSAIEAYQQALMRDRKFIASYENLGKIYLQQKQYELAIETYQLLLNISQRSFKAPVFEKLAEVYQAMGDQTLVTFYLGYAAYFNNDNQGAIPYFENFLLNNTGILDIYLMLTRCYQQINEPELAINTVKRALLNLPQHCLTLTRLDQSILPVLYKNSEEIQFYRQRFSQKLEKLIQDIRESSLDSFDENFRILQTGNNYYLGYQGFNDIELQKKCSEYVFLIVKRIYPQWCQPIRIDKDIQQRKLRIGYVSSRLHGLGLLYLGWLKYKNSDKLETYVYDISGYDETIKGGQLDFRNNFQQYGDYFRFIDSQIDKICDCITTDKLDILMLPEIGLDPIMNHLSCLRLAPIQCTTWAHPITSGSPNIDYFLSSDLMEPDNAKEHYSEKLVKLPNLAFSINHPDISASEKVRSDFYLLENSIVYFSCQSLIKFLPQYDYIFPAIAKKNTLAQFVFLDSFLGSIITSSFKQRLEKAFSQFDLNYEDYCIFLPRLSPEDYIRLNQLSDIFLDSFAWSGGISTTDAIACGLPVVTCPGEMMRARHSYGILRMIGVTETIAKNEAEYIEIAVRLGLDEEWRQAIREKIMANKHRMFDDQECIVALEAFFEKAVQKHSQEQHFDTNLIKEDFDK